MSVWKAFGDGVRDGLRGDSGRAEEPATSALPPEVTAPSTSPSVEQEQTPAVNRPLAVNNIALAIVAVVVVLLLIALLVHACNRQKVGKSSDPSAQRAALTLLETIPVKGWAPKTGYSREQFGPPWTDDVNVEFGHNGCDTRDDILRRDLSNVGPPSGCTVLA